MEDCLANIKNGNALWKYFGLTARTETLEGGSSVEGQLAMMNRQLEDLRGAINRESTETGKFGSGLVARVMKQVLDEEEEKEVIFHKIHKLAKSLGIQIATLEQTPDQVDITAVAGAKGSHVAIFDAEARKIARGHGKYCHIGWTEAKAAGKA